MKPKSSHRYRICGTPVKTGCITCKIRRVKCGEEKPDCSRCTSTGRKCDGYTSPDKPNTPTSSPVRPSSSSMLPEDPLEQHMLSFFKSSTAPRLSGYFSSDFWETRVLRATNEPSIRHGVIAIGAVHQNFFLRRECPEKECDLMTEAFAFRQHTKAISHLQQLMSVGTRQLDITLIACILFIVFDCLLGNHTSAIMHLKAGLKILEDIKLQDAQGTRSVHTASAHEWEREFSPLLLALGTQVAACVYPSLREEGAALWASLKRVGLSTYSTTFHSLDEGRHALDTLMADIMTDRTSTADRINADRIPNPRGPEGQRHFAALERWEETLERSLPEIVKGSTLVCKTQLGALMLTAHGVFLSTTIGMPESTDDKFKKLLDLCGTILQTKSDFGLADLSFSVDLGLIAPLFFVALRARQKCDQQRAYHLLLLAPGREGMWDNEDALRVAGGAVEIGACQGHHEMSALPRAWDDAADEPGMAVSYPQTEDPFNGPGLIHGTAFPRSIPSRSGLPFTKEEYLSADRPCD